MYDLDRREEFNNMLWQQGMLLDTVITRQLSKEVYEVTDYIERCCAFINFSYKDNGVGRELVYRFDTPKECMAAVIKHNSEFLRSLNEQ